MVVQVYFFGGDLCKNREIFTCVALFAFVCISLVQLLNVILLFMYMSLFFKQYFVNVWICGKASLCCEAGPDS